MLPDWPLILGFASVGIILVGGFIKLRLENALGFQQLGSRLTRIETCMELETAAKPDRIEARKWAAHQIARAEIACHVAECPRREVTGVTNTGGF